MVRTHPSNKTQKISALKVKRAIKVISSDGKESYARLSEKNLQQHIGLLTQELNLSTLDDKNNSLIKRPTQKEITDFKNEGVVFLIPQRKFNRYLDGLNQLLSNIEQRYYDKGSEKFKDVVSVLRNQDDPEHPVKIDFLADKIISQQEKEFIETFENVIVKHLTQAVNAIFENQYSFKPEDYCINNGVLLEDRKEKTKRNKAYKQDWHIDDAGSISVIMPLRDHPPTEYIPLENRHKVMQYGKIKSDLCKEYATSHSDANNRFMVFTEENIKSVDNNLPVPLIHAAPKHDPHPARFIFSCDFSI